MYKLFELLGLDKFFELRFLEECKEKKNNFTVRCFFSTVEKGPHKGREVFEYEAYNTKFDYAVFNYEPSDEHYYYDKFKFTYMPNLKQLTVFSGIYWFKKITLDKHQHDIMMDYLPFCV